MPETINLDLVILGGGVAGLWALNRAVAAGYNAVLFEQHQLGSGQTIHAQGIIHGGIKYSLNGVLSPASNAIKDMPMLWRDCINGDGDIDLSSVKLLSDAHYLWSNKNVGSRLTTFFASKAIRGRVTDTNRHERPAIFQNPAFNGALYRLNELVLDVPSLLKSLAAQHQERIIRAGPGDYRLTALADGTYRLAFADAQLEINATQVLVTCGEGYQFLNHALPGALPEMQTRPLHMVMVKHHSELPLYAHCLGGGTRPLVTVTTHYTKNHDTVWYLGGELAESGVKKDPRAQIHDARRLIDDLLPWVKLEKPAWATVRINRAEPKQTSLTLPDAAFAERRGNLVIAWPTKLALAPDLANKVLTLLATPKGGKSFAALNVLPKPTIAEAIWEHARWT